MESYNLSGVPIPDRELMQINQNQVMQILEEIERLKAIASDKSNPQSASASKRLTNATRALADVVSTPELFAGYTPNKNIKYIGEGYYGVGKKFLEDMQLDPMGLTGGKSTMHHNDSLKQLFRAIYDPDPNIRYQVIQGLREAKEGDIGSTLQNLSDTEAKGGHRIYHADPETGKTDYKNRAATAPTLELGPNSTVKARVAGGAESMRIQGEVTAAAQQSEIVQGRNVSMLADIAETPGGQQLLDKYGNPLDPKNPLRTPEAIKEFRNLNVQYTPVLETVGGSIRLNRARMTALAGAGLAGFSWLGTAASAAETVGRGQIAAQTKNPLDFIQTGLSALSTAADVVPVIGEVVSTPADAANVLIDTARESAKAIKDPKVRAEDIGAYRKAMKPHLYPSKPPKVKTKPKEKSTIEKVIDDPMNELEYVGKQLMGGLKVVGGAILFGF